MYGLLKNKPPKKKKNPTLLTGIFHVKTLEAKLLDTDVFNRY